MPNQYNKIPCFKLMVVPTYLKNKLSRSALTHLDAAYKNKGGMSQIRLDEYSNVSNAGISVLEYAHKRPAILIPALAINHTKDLYFFISKIGFLNSVRFFLL